MASAKQPLLFSFIMTRMNTSTNLPERFIEKLEQMYPNTFKTVIKSFDTKPAPSFRVNTLISNRNEVQRYLTEQGFVVNQVEWYNDAFVLENKSIRELTETDIYQNGLIYIQNLSSMIPALVLNPQPNERILDLAAAPGSKTTQLAAMMQNTGEIIANDVSRKRLYKTQELLKQYGITNTKISVAKGEFLWKRFPEVFDKTLIDVPCSMEGRINTSDPKTYADWSPRKVKQLAMLQKYLLRSAISATNVGGVIVYSTCTLSPEENEEVVEWALQKSEGAVTVEKIDIQGLHVQSGLTTWKKKTMNYTENCVRVLPNTSMEGFFVAKLRKTTSTVPGMEIFQ